MSSTSRLYLVLKPDSNSSPGIGGALQICTKRVGGCWQRLNRYGASRAMLRISTSIHQVLYRSPRTGIIARASPEAAWRLPLFGGRKLEMEKANQPFSRRRIVFFPRRANFTSPTPDPAPLVWASQPLFSHSLFVSYSQPGPAIGCSRRRLSATACPLTLLDLRIGARYRCASPSNRNHAYVTESGT